MLAKTNLFTFAFSAASAKAMLASTFDIRAVASSTPRNCAANVLDSLAEALRLSADERRHLHMLARRAESESEPKDANPEVSSGLERTILALDPNPAFILGPSWDLLIWNRAAELVFRLPAFSKETGQCPNWLRRFLTDPSIRTNNADWEAKAQVMIARFRADYASYPQDTRLRALIEELMQISELFRFYWPRHDVQLAADCHKRWRNPDIGEMEFEQVTLQQPSNPDMKMMIYTASPSTAERLRMILSKNGEK